MNRFSNFTNTELKVLEAILARVGGDWAGYRGDASRMFDEVLQTMNDRGVSVAYEENRIRDVNGSIVFGD